MDVSVPDTRNVERAIEGAGKPSRVWRKWQLLVASMYSVLRTPYSGSMQWECAVGERSGVSKGCKVFAFCLRTQLNAARGSRVA
jgi:hypothetical protein